MPRSPRFQIGFAPEAVDHIATIDRKHHHLIEQTLDDQLCYAPDQETRNRKPLEQPAPFDATWELRFGPANCFRVFYEVDRAERIVWVLAVGIKKRSRLLIGTEEFAS